MELNSKKLERTSKIIYNTISVILCLFLILLSSKIIDDLDTTTTRPEIEQFENKNALTDLDKKNKILEIELENLNNKKNSLEKTISTAKENCKNEQQSFDNWVQTRKTLGSPNKDEAVIERVNNLDVFYKIEKEWRSQLSSEEKEIKNAETIQAEISLQIEKENEIAEKKYEEELKRYDLKVFFIRLLFVAPILALGIFFFIRYRKNKFWPLYFGFTLFSFYAFFFGLVPYLPSYGGYIRYTVGIILSVSLGYYAIKRIRAFIEEKQTELKVSTQERAKNVQIEVAEKALENHFCPSCGKDFLIKKWELPVKLNDIDTIKLATDFCRHCGLELFSNCKTCSNRNFAHLPFCSTCGTKSTKENYL